MSRTLSQLATRSSPTRSGAGLGLNASAEMGSCGGVGSSYSAVGPGGGAAICACCCYTALDVDVDVDVLAVAVAVALAGGRWSMSRTKVALLFFLKGPINSFPLAARRASNQHHFSNRNRGREGGREVHSALEEGLIFTWCR